MDSTPRPSKLPQRLHLEFGRMIISRFCDMEKFERSISAFRNHLHFTLHCKHHGVYPTSLTLKCSMHGLGVDIILRAQRALLNEWINRIKKELEFYKNKRADCDEFLFMQLPSDMYEEVLTWMVHARLTSFNNIHDRHIRKFEQLMRKHRGSCSDNEPISKVDEQEKENIKSKWVVNLSDHVLSDDEVSLLKKGLNFAVTPSKIPINEYVIGIESACKLLGSWSKASETTLRLCEDYQEP